MTRSLPARLRQFVRIRPAFISYRRADASGFAALVDERLRRRYGKQRVFRDVESIEAGEDWRERLDRALDEAAVVVAIVGTDWAGAGEPGRRRIDHADDMVRYELVQANARELEVLPLITEAKDLAPHRPLPADLAFLDDLQSTQLYIPELKAVMRRLVRKTDLALGWWARRLHRWLVSAAGVTAVVALVAGLLWLGPPPPPDLSQELGLQAALASITESVDGRSETTTLTETLSAELESRLNQGFGGDIDVTKLHPEYSIAAPAEGDRRLQAQGLARTTHADVIVTATLTRGSNESRLSPEIYLGEVVDLEELAGRQLEFDARGALVDSDVAVVDGDAVRLLDGLVEELYGMVRYLTGVGAYQSREFERAIDLLGDAANNREWRGLSGAVLHQLIGNSHAALDHHDEARVHYELALASQPDFVRAELGLVEVAYLASHGGCAPGSIDRAAVRDVADRFHRIRVEQSNELIALTASFGEARARGCLVRSSPVADADAAGGAIREFLRVTETVPDDPELRRPVTEVVAEAHFELALLYEFLAHAATAPDRQQLALVDRVDGSWLDGALGQLAAVRGATNRPERRADAWIVEARIRSSIEDLTGSEVARRNAIDALDRAIDKRIDPFGIATLLVRRARQHWALARTTGDETLQVQGDLDYAAALERLGESVAGATALASCEGEPHDEIWQCALAGLAAQQ